MAHRPRWTILGMLLAAALPSLASPTPALARGKPCVVSAANLRPTSIAGLRIDRVTRQGDWLRYTGRYRDTYVVVETAPCERYVRRLLLISPVGPDPWSRLESLRRLFALPPVPLAVDQRAELQQKGRLQLTSAGIQVTYDYKAVGMASVIGLDLVGRP